MKCPGQDMQYWNEEAIFEVPCATCGKSIEFYKDDTNRKCGNCGNRMVNPRLDFGCAAYCQFAEQCLGTLPEEFVGQQDNLLKDRVAVEVKRLLKTDFRRIGHISRFAQYAEKIGREERINLGVTLCAAYLLDIDETDVAAAGLTTTSDRKPAEMILAKLSAKDAIIKEVCNLLEGYRADCSTSDRRELLILADAATLAGLEEDIKQKLSSSGHPNDISPQELHTESGRQLAAKLLHQ